jgi:hypothetical protein
MARYAVTVNSGRMIRFNELDLAKRYARSLPAGTVVEILDSVAAEPLRFVVPDGEKTLQPLKNEP